MSRNRIPIALQAQTAGKRQPPPTQMMKDDKYGSAAEIMSLPPLKLLAVLQDQSASQYSKAKACQRLAVVGDASAVPALRPLLSDPVLSHYARTALEPMPGKQVDEALRAALANLQGRLLIGVISSIGKRRDPEAIVALERLRRGDDVEVSRAASVALGHIRPVL